MERSISRIPIVAFVLFFALATVCYTTAYFMSTDLYLLEPTCPPLFKFKGLADSKPYKCARKVTFEWERTIWKPMWLLESKIRGYVITPLTHEQMAPVGGGFFADQKPLYTWRRARAE